MDKTIGDLHEVLLELDDDINFFPDGTTSVEQSDTNELGEDEEYLDIQSYEELQLRIMDKFGG